MSDGGSIAASLFRNVPAIMLATSPIASGISPLAAVAGKPSNAPVMPRAASTDV